MLNFLQSTNSWEELKVRGTQKISLSILVKQCKVLLKDMWPQGSSTFSSLPPDNASFQQQTCLQETWPQLTQVTTQWPNQTLIQTLSLKLRPMSHIMPKGPVRQINYHLTMLKRSSPKGSKGSLRIILKWHQLTIQTIIIPVEQMVTIPH